MNLHFNAKAAIHIYANLVNHNYKKHIEADCHVVSERVALKTIYIVLSKVKSTGFGLLD